MIKMLKYLKQTVTVVVSLYLFSAALAAPYFLAKWSEANDVINYQQVQISSLSAKLQERAATPDKVIISCANNQRDYVALLERMEKKYKMPKGLMR
jgi:hypothetical protein